MTTQSCGHDVQVIKDRIYIESMSDYTKPELWLWVLI